MVQRAQLLLNRCVMMLLMAALIGCSVDTLKIYMPPRGIQSIHQEDLKRALWNLERGADSMLWWTNRASQVNLSATDIHGCFLHEGRTSDVLTIVAVSTPIEVATLASMGKAVDKVETSHGWQFCTQEKGTSRIESFDNMLYVSDIVDVESSFVDVNFTLWAQQIRESMKQQGL